MGYRTRVEVTVSHRVRLFGSRLSPFVEKVARALALKRIAYELVEPRSPLEFARWNPQTRKIPVLEVERQPGSDSSLIRLSSPTRRLTVLEVDRERLYDSTFILRNLDLMVASPPLLSG